MYVYIHFKDVMKRRARTRSCRVLAKLCINQEKKHSTKYSQRLTRAMHILYYNGNPSNNAEGIAQMNTADQRA